jgi:hypothetical protein
MSTMSASMTSWAWPNCYLSSHKVDFGIDVQALSELPDPTIACPSLHAIHCSHLMCKLQRTVHMPATCKQQTLHVDCLYGAHLAVLLRCMMQGIAFKTTLLGSTHCM